MATPKLSVRVTTVSTTVLAGGFAALVYLWLQQRRARRDSSTFELGDGNRLPAVGFGTFTIPDADAERCVATALRRGYVHIDTAEFYGNERGVGRAIAASGLARSSVFVTTKLDPGAVQWGQTAKTYETTLAACERSVRERLGLSYVDLYLIHTPLSGREGRVEQWRACVECQRLGLCKSIGVSNFEVHHLEELEAAGLPPPAANQIELHPLCQKRELLAYMRARGIAPIAYSSLAPLSTWREGYAAFGGSKSGGALATSSRISEVAKRVGVSEAKLLLRYALQKGWAVLPKSVSDARLRENIDLASFTIPEPEMAALDAMESDAAYAFGSPGEPFDPTKFD